MLQLKDSSQHQNKHQVICQLLCTPTQVYTVYKDWQVARTGLTVCTVRPLVPSLQRFVGLTIGAGSFYDIAYHVIYFFLCIRLSLYCLCMVTRHCNKINIKHHFSLFNFLFCACGFAVECVGYPLYLSFACVCCGWFRHEWWWWHGNPLGVQS